MISCFLGRLHFKDLYICTNLKYIHDGEENIDHESDSTDEKWEEGVG